MFEVLVNIGIIIGIGAVIGAVIGIGTGVGIGVVKALVEPSPSLPSPSQIEEINRRV